MTAARPLVLVALLCACSNPIEPAADAASPDGGASACSADLDCDDGLFCTGVERCRPSDPAADADGCVGGSSPCGSAEICLEGSARCVRCEVGDMDGDGFSAVECGGDDCDDTDPGRFPGNVEVCDGDDEDCDPATLGHDADADGFVPLECCNPNSSGSMMVCGTDCDDTMGGVNPGTPEACNGIDDDCDGDVDEGVISTCYEDADDDGYAPAGAASREQCMSCAETAGWASEPTGPGTTDCDDARAAVHPGAADPCDGVDNDCDGVAEDADMDGHASTMSSCSGGTIPRDDCNDRIASIRPGATPAYRDEPHCPTGAMVACLSGATWRCDRPRLSTGINCDMAAAPIGGAGGPSFDWDCNGVVDVEQPVSPATRPCQCTGARCGFGRSSGMLTAALSGSAPASVHPASACGTLIVGHYCRAIPAGSCGGLGGSSCGTSTDSAASPSYRLPCR